MYKAILSLVLLSVLPLSARVVKEPEFMSNSLMTYIESIELTDTATRVNLRFVNQPKRKCMLDSVMMVGRTTDKEYRLVRVENYTIGTKQAMPESGQYPFTLVYGPLDREDTSVDLVMGGAGISGLDLTEKRRNKKYHTHLTGTYNKPESMIWLEKKQMTKSDNTKGRWIPVKDGRFEADLYSDMEEAYELCDEFMPYKGSWRYVTLFSENGEVNVDFYGLDVDDAESTVTAAPGSLTESYNTANKRVSELMKNSAVVQRYNSLHKAKTFYVPEYYEIEERFRTHPEEKDSLRLRMNRLFSSGNFTTTEAEKAEDDLKRWQKTDFVRAKADIAAGLGSLAGLYMLYNAVGYADDASVYTAAYRDHYAGKFSDHPYSQYFEKIGDSIDPVPGRGYNDFTAPGLDGKMYTLSEQIKGRPALIDLWASWCGGCRKSSMSMLPVYEQFAPKGFTIVGVARERKNTDAMKKAIQQDGYPWLNLVELDDEQNLWAKYRCPTGGGKVILVGPDGIVVAVNPTAEDVHKYLTEFYK